MTSEIAHEVFAENLEVEFPIYGPDSRSLKNTTFRLATGGRISRGPDDGRVVVKALDQISFHFKPGDRVGLVGNNGSGKTTLLRTIAGIYEPTGGTLSVLGNVASMLAIGLGMDAELSGYENIMIRGLVMGMSKSDVRELADEVIEFTELGDYINMPLRTYSTGMSMRLAFGISTAVKADIIIMDEWLSVGDAEFAKKAEARLERMLDDAKILILASHSSALIDMVCNRVVHLDHGKILSDSRDWVRSS